MLPVQSGYKLSTYAVNWIRQEVMRAQRQADLFRYTPGMAEGTAARRRYRPIGTQSTDAAWERTAQAMPCAAHVALASPPPLLTSCTQERRVQGARVEHLSPLHQQSCPIFIAGGHRFTARPTALAQHVCPARAAWVRLGGLHSHGSSVQCSQHACTLGLRAV